MRETPSEAHVAYSDMPIALSFDQSQAGRGSTAYVPAAGAEGVALALAEVADATVDEAAAAPPPVIEPVPAPVPAPDDRALEADSFAESATAERFSELLLAAREPNTPPSTAPRITAAATIAPMMIHIVLRDFLAGAYGFSGFLM